MWCQGLSLGQVSPMQRLELVRPGNALFFLPSYLPSLFFFLFWWCSSPLLVLCSGINTGRALGTIYGARDSKPGLMHAGEVSYMLYYHSGSSKCYFQMKYHLIYQYLYIRGKNQIILGHGLKMKHYLPSSITGGFLRQQYKNNGRGVCGGGG